MTTKKTTTKKKEVPARKSEQIINQLLSDIEFATDVAPITWKSALGECGLTEEKAKKLKVNRGAENFLNQVENQCLEYHCLLEANRYWMKIFSDFLGKNKGMYDDLMDKFDKYLSVEGPGNYRMKKGKVVRNEQGQVLLTQHAEESRVEMLGTFGTEFQELINFYMNGKGNLEGLAKEKDRYEAAVRTLKNVIDFYK